MNAKWHEFFEKGDTVVIKGFRFRVSMVKANGRLNLKRIGEIDEK